MKSNTIQNLPIVLLVMGLMCISCTETRQSLQTTVRPNILWIFLEDTAPLLGCYGTSLIATPNIDSLARNGVLYTNAFMPAPVCSASRSSIITGVMSTTFGGHNHHSSRTRESAISLPRGTKTIPELFQKAGFFTFNNGKDDYNFAYNRRELYKQDYTLHPLYGKGGVPLEIASLKNKQPFFGQIQLRGGKEIFSSTFREKVKTPVDRDNIELPPYLPDHPALIEEYANHLDAIQVTDEKVGDIVKKLKESDLLSNTIVFFFSDHGMRLTRNKQFLYDGGIHVPLIIADFTHGNGKLRSGSVNDDLVSGLDLGTSSLALAGIEIPNYMEGRNIFNDSIDPREFVISTRDRCDFTIDRIRSVRSNRFKYIRNFITNRPYTQPTYMDVDGVEFVKVMRHLHAAKELDSIQDRFMSDERPYEELYDIRKDPYELHNLAEAPEYSEALKEHAGILDAWIADTGDKGQYAENEEGLMFMLGIWGQYCVNPEYDPLRKKYPGLEGSLFYLKSEPAILVDSSFIGDPLPELPKTRMGK